MLLLRKQNIGKAGKLGVWNIQESISELLNEMILSSAEKQKLDSISVEEKKIQWLCCKKTLNLLTEKNYAIDYDIFGKPFIKDTDLHVSFSHSQRFCAVIIDTKNTGIDIEMIRPTILKINKKFLHPDELNCIPVEENKAIITSHIYWGTKEALYKCYGKKELLFAEQLLIDSFEDGHQSGTLTGHILIKDKKITHKLGYQKLKDSILVYIIND